MTRAQWRQFALAMIPGLIWISIVAALAAGIIPSGIDAKRDPVTIVNALDAQYPDWQARYPGSDFETALYSYLMEPEPAG